jgi:hypothetical protein
MVCALADCGVNAGARKNSKRWGAKDKGRKRGLMTVDSTIKACVGRQEATLFRILHGDCLVDLLIAIAGL